jgi:hypothetical protein
MQGCIDPWQDANLLVDGRLTKRHGWQRLRRPTSYTPRRAMYGPARGVKAQLGLDWRLAEQKRDRLLDRDSVGD